MKKSLLTTLWIGVTYLLLLGPAYAADVKIGVIDTQKIMRESRAAKMARVDFLKEIEMKRNILAAKQQEVKAMEEELKNKGKNMAPSVRKEKADNLARGVKKLKRLRSDLEEELKKKEKELNRKLLREISEIVKEYSKKEKYSVILEKRSVVR
ncbi:MAG: OmpH family outer membrane protein [Deltaproteobacteria bacterium]|nr:OmpH family outer membrane protein [Deltaproteobacteria bacterium]